MANRQPKVHAKVYSKDAWEPIGGTLYLRSLSHIDEMLQFAPMSPMHSGELIALDNFIAYKGWCVARLQHVEKNFIAIEQT